MKYPWNIYPNLWQNSDFVTTQSLNNIDDHVQSNWSFFFKYSPLKQYYGIHSLVLNVNQLSLGIVSIEEITCTFPNGENFTYNCNWKKFNGSHYLNDNNDNIYSIECQLKNYSNLFQNRNFLQLVLIIEQNSFQQDKFFSIVSEVEDIIENNDINIVTVRLPIVKLIPIDLVKNYNNYLPIIQIEITNEIFSLLKYQYPIIYIKSSDIIGKDLEKFINDLYKKINYIYRENKNLSSHLNKLLSMVFEYIFTIQSLLKNGTLTVIGWYEKSLNLLGNLETLMEFNWKIYLLNNNDILKTFYEITNRINYIFDNFYNLGTIGILEKNNDKYYFSCQVNKSYQLYLDFTIVGEKQDLINWIESSIIDEENKLDNNLLEKNRGLNRWLIDSKINNSTGEIWIRYQLDIINYDKVSYVLFNPIVINNMNITWLIKQIS